MDAAGVQLGSSLPVPCVQELAKEHRDSVPERYLRPDQDHPVVPDSALCNEVPVIDMDKLLFQDSMDSELAKLDFACKEWGFFQLINHGVDSFLVEKIKKEVQDFFNLPMEEKKKFWQHPGEVQGFGQAFVVSEEQKLDWADIFFVVSRPLNERKPHLFPKLALPFRDSLEAYSMELENLTKKLVELMAKALKMEMQEMEELFNDGQLQYMRMNYYPPCALSDKVIGLTPHSDAVGLTILLQVSEVDGLQIRKDGNWIPVKPLPGAFVINIGDIMEMITNGIYRSIEHRATVDKHQERLSLATFHTPAYKKEIGPAPSLVSEQRPALFRRILAEDYFKGLFTRELKEKSYLDAMRI